MPYGDDHPQPGPNPDPGPGGRFSDVPEPGMRAKALAIWNDPRLTYRQKIRKVKYIIAGARR